MRCSMKPFLFLSMLFLTAAAFAAENLACSLDGGGRPRWWNGAGDTRITAPGGSLTIAIDGPGGAGKSTIARRAAAELGFVYVDTGAIYRAVACAALSRGIDPSDEAAVSALLPSLQLELRWTEDGVQHVWLNGADISSELRTPAVSTAASRVSALPVVRQFLLEQQRVVARKHDVIMDGRDIGTVVLPDADVKIFLSASPEVRARRRWLELQEKGTPDTYEAVLADLIARDERDSNRAIAPLRPADDAVLLDTSGMTLQESIDAILKLIRKKVTV